MVGYCHGISIFCNSNKLDALFEIDIRIILEDTADSLLYHQRRRTTFGNRALAARGTEFLCERDRHQLHDRLS